MKKRFLTVTVMALAFSAAVVARADASSTQPATTSVQQAENQKLSGELQELLNQLSIKKKELAKLRRKWITVKGRTPSEEELEEFNEQRAEGAVSFEDNPYVNQNPLSSPGIYRKAYYEKLAEVRSVEAKIASLREAIDDLNQ